MKRPQRNPDVEWRRYERGALTESGVAMNSSATRILELCDGTRDLGQIAEAYGAHYGIDPAQAVRDATTTVAELDRFGVLVEGAGQPIP